MGDSEETTPSSSSLPGLLGALASGARAVHGLPLEDDFSFESSFPEFSKALGETQDTLLQTLSLALRYTSAIDDDDNAGDGDDNDNSNMMEFRNIQDPMLWEACADSCEALIEKVEAFLKDGSGEHGGEDDENIALATAQLNNIAGRAREKAKSSLGRLVESTVEMEKPQDTFQIDVTTLNDRQEPFVPLVHPDKPFSVVPLDLSQAGIGGGGQQAPHVYQKEIKELEFRPWQLETTTTKPEEEIQIASKLEATWVDTVDGLKEMAQKLESVQEVAIDLEAHSYRSFAGILCLMQISFRSTSDDNNTKMKNYLIDVFPVWKQINTYLAPMFANPDIVKVMHGADFDIQWLQRDFGIYVVNLFDTGRAARALGLSSAGLAYALKKYVNFEADKTHQLSDWRQRPLPEAMRQYAISDTHYLLDVYERMKWDLTQNKSTSIEQVLDSSRKISQIVYKKNTFQPMGYKSLMKRRRGGNVSTKLNAQQEQVLEKLWEWRDRTARQCDESPVYVCPNPVLMRISLSSPTTVSALQTLLNPIPPLVLKYATAVTQIVRKVHTNAKLAASSPSADRQQVTSSPSSAFFKPAEPAGEDSIRRAGVLSPVLGTEALYKQAGWITPVSGRDVRRMAEDQELVPIATTTEEEGDSDALVDSAAGSGSGPSSGATATKPRNALSVNRANKDYAAQQHTSHSLGMGKDGGGGKRGTTTGGQPRSRTVVDGIGAASAAREHSQSPVPNLTMEQEMRAAQQDAAMIQSGISRKEAMLGLISPPLLDGEEEDFDNADDEGRRTGAGGGGFDMDEGDKDAGATAGENEEEFVIPRSMQEIYKISNRNRRNKKQPSPTPDRPTVPTNEVEMEHLAKAEKLLKARGLDGKGYFDEGSKGASPGKRQRTKSAGTEQDGSAPGSADNSFNVSREEDMVFMQEIGWIKDKEEADTLMGQGDAAAEGDTGGGGAGAGNEVTAGDEDIGDDDAAGGGGNTGKSNRDTTKTPTAFDYSSGMGASLNPQPQQQQGGGGAVANPFFSGAALAGGPLTQGGGTSSSSRSDRKKNSSGSSRGGKQNRNRQERPEKRDGKTHAYRKR